MESIFEDSWVYQEWKQAGVEQGLQQGREQGREQGLQQSIVAIVEKYFPALTTVAQERTAFLKTPEQLQNLLLQIVGVQDEQEVRRILLAVGEEQK